MAARRPFWKWHRWKSIGFCLWPLSTCIWNLKLKFQSKLDLCSGNHVVYRQTDRRTDGRTDKVNPVYPPSNFVGRGYNKSKDVQYVLLSTSGRQVAKKLKQCPRGNYPSACVVMVVCRGSLHKANPRAQRPRPGLSVAWLQACQTEDNSRVWSGVIELKFKMVITISKLYL